VALSFNRQLLPTPSKPANAAVVLSKFLEDEDFLLGCSIVA